MVRHVPIGIFLAIVLACTAVHAADPNHTATLPDGTTVELVAIRPCSISDPRRFKDRSGPWWTPDGAPQEVCPDLSRWGTSWGHSYLMVVALDNADDVSCSAAGPLDTDIEVQHIKKKGPGFENRNLYRFTMRFDDRTSADIHLAVATGPWSQADYWGISESSTPYNHSFVSSEQVVMRCPQQEGPDVVAEVTQVMGNRATRLVAIDRDEGLHLPEVERGGYSAGLVRTIHRFKDMDRDTIDRFEFQDRPYEYCVTFEDVSLDSGHETQFEMYVKKQGSLLRAPLPSLESITTPKQRTTLKDKALCVCFFDMAQRPSRRAVTDLAGMAQTLAEQDVAVVLVQGPQVDEEVVDQWLAECEVPSDGVVFRGRFEDDKGQWGVRSLPWLILTDRKHVVAAEGFPLSRLGEKLNELPDDTP